MRKATVKYTLLSTCVLLLTQFFFSDVLICECVSLSDDDVEELLASILELEKYKEHLPLILADNDLKEEDRSSSRSSSSNRHPIIELHPSLWSSEYYEVKNSKSNHPQQQTNSKKAKVSPNVKHISNILKSQNETLSFLKKRPSLSLATTSGSKYKSNYLIERESEEEGIENEIIRFGSSSRTILHINVVLWKNLTFICVFSV